MMSYWVLFIGIAVASWLVQMNLQNKFKKYSKIPTGNGMTGQWNLRCTSNSYTRSADRPLQSC